MLTRSDYCCLRPSKGISDQVILSPAEQAENKLLFFKNVFPLWRAIHILVVSSLQTRNFNPRQRISNHSCLECRWRTGTWLCGSDSQNQSFLERQGFRASNSISGTPEWSGWTALLTDARIETTNSSSSLRSATGYDFLLSGSKIL